MFHFSAPGSDKAQLRETAGYTKPCFITFFSGQKVSLISFTGKVTLEYIWMILLNTKKKDLKKFFLEKNKHKL